MTEPLRDFLLNRRSIRAREIDPDRPGPNAEQLQRILTIGTRVPDHGKLAPWRLVLFEGEARRAFGDRLAAIFEAAHPDVKPMGLEEERKRFTRAPLVIAVISTAQSHKIPVWEQQLSAGAVCFNLGLAAQAEGFGAVWLTEWPAYDDRVAQLLGMADDDRIAGFIYIGHAPAQEDRPRPALEAVVSRWSPT